MYLIMYGYVIWLTIVFAVAYFKRFLWIAVLIVFAPIMCLMYSFGKFSQGIFKNWFKTFAGALLVQPYHILIYYVVIAIPLGLAEGGDGTAGGLNILGFDTGYTSDIQDSFQLIYALVAMAMIRPIEKWTRKLFQMDNGVARMASYDSGKQTIDTIKKAVKEVAKTIATVVATVYTGGAAAGAMNAGKAAGAMNAGKAAGAMNAGKAGGAMNTGKAGNGLPIGGKNGSGMDIQGQNSKSTPADGASGLLDENNTPKNDKTEDSGMNIGGAGNDLSKELSSVDMGEGERSFRDIVDRFGEYVNAFTQNGGQEQIFDLYTGLMEGMYLDGDAPRHEWDAKRKAFTEDRKEKTEDKKKNYVNNIENIEFVIQKHDLVQKCYDRQSDSEKNWKKAEKEAEDLAKARLEKSAQFIDYGYSPNVQLLDGLQDVRKEKGLSPKDTIFYLQNYYNLKKEAMNQNISEEDFEEYFSAGIKKMEDLTRVMGLKQRLESSGRLSQEISEKLAVELDKRKMEAAEKKTKITYTGNNRDMSEIIAILNNEISNGIY